MCVQLIKTWLLELDIVEFIFCRLCKNQSHSTSSLYMMMRLCYVNFFCILLDSHINDEAHSCWLTVENFWRDTSIRTVVQQNTLQRNLLEICLILLFNGRKYVWKPLEGFRIISHKFFLILEFISSQMHYRK